MVVLFATLIVCTGSLLAKEVSDRIAAIVNSDVITLSELQAEMQEESVRLRARHSGKELDRQLTYATYDILNSLIERKLLLQEAKAKGVKVTDEEIDQASEHFILRNQSSDASLKISRERIRQELVIQRLWDFQVRRHVMVAPEGIRFYYRKFASQFTESPKYRIRQILLIPDPQEDITDVMQRARQLYKKLKDGENFSNYAQRYSDGPASMHGGELGYIAKNELLGPIVQALEVMNIGDISLPIRSSLGIHIVILDDMQSGTIQPFEEVKTKIRALLYKQKTLETQEALIGNLKHRAYIEILF